MIGTPYTENVHTKEATDFIVRQVDDQAALDGVPFSDLEKRRMYFTEHGEPREDIVALEEELRAQYDEEEYEKKIAQLLAGACRRLKRRLESYRTWKCRSTGTPQRRVCWFHGSPNNRAVTIRFSKLIGTTLLVVVVGGPLMFGLIWLPDKYHFVPARRGEPNAHGSLPVGLQRVILGLMLGGYAYYVILPAVLRRYAMGVTELVLKILPRNRKDHVKSE